MRKLPIIALLLLLSSPAWPATYYMRADGTAANKAAATGPVTDASACMSVATHNGETFSAGDIILLSSLGGTYSASIVVPSAGSDGSPVTYRNATGEVPIINGDVQYQFNCATGDHFITIDGLTFSGGTGTPSASIRLFRSHGHVVQNCVFTGVTASYGVFIYSDDTAAAYDEIADSNVFTGNTGVENIRIEHNLAAAYNLTFSDNVITGGVYGVRFYGSEAGVGVADVSPYNVQITGNTVSSTEKAAFQLQTGIKNTGGVSYISDNILTSIGNGTNEQVNAMQLAWCRGLVVEDNTITGVNNASAGDGDGIILDWGFTSNSYLSDACIVRRNIVTGCDDGVASAGINVYKATNSEVYWNISHDNSVGFRLANAESTGAVFYNNTGADNVVSDVRIDDPLAGGGAPASTWANNIFSGSPYSIKIYNSSTAPTETYNIHNGSTGNIDDGSPVALDATSYDINPLLNASYAPSNSTALTGGNFIAAFHGTVNGQSDNDKTFIFPARGSIPIGAQGHAYGGAVRLEGVVADGGVRVAYVATGGIDYDGAWSVYTDTWSSYTTAWE